MADARKNPKGLTNAATEPAATQTAPPNEVNPLETPPEIAKPKKTRGKRNKAQSWKEKANVRVPRALKAIQSVADIAKPSHYEYTEEEAKRLLSLFNRAMDALDRAYLKPDTVPTEALLF